MRFKEDSYLSVLISITSATMNIQPMARTTLYVLHLRERLHLIASYNTITSISNGEKISSGIGSGDHQKSERILVAAVILHALNLLPANHARALVHLIVVKLHTEPFYHGKKIDTSITRSLVSLPCCHKILLEKILFCILAFIVVTLVQFSTVQWFSAAAQN